MRPPAPSLPPSLTRSLAPSLPPSIPPSLARAAQVYFSVYNGVKSRIGHGSSVGGGGRGREGGRGDARQPLGVNFFAAACAGCSTTFITNPLWVVKTRLQTQSLAPGGADVAGGGVGVGVDGGGVRGGVGGGVGGRGGVGGGVGGGVSHRRVYLGTFDALVRIAREEGLRGMYSGLGPSLLGCFHVIIQFPLYEMLKEHIALRCAEPASSPARPYSP